MTNYVMGFGISEDHITLVQKLKGPAINYGKWNGIGGKVKEGENDYDAMIREWKEETNIEILLWEYLGTLHGRGWVVTCYYHKADFSEALPKVNDVEEPLGWFHIDNLPTLAENLKTIIPHLFYGKGIINIFTHI